MPLGRDCFLKLHLLMSPNIIVLFSYFFFIGEEFRIFILFQHKQIWSDPTVIFKKINRYIRERNIPPLAQQLPSLSYCLTAVRKHHADTSNILCSSCQSQTIFLMFFCQCQSWQPQQSGLNNPGSQGLGEHCLRVPSHFILLLQDTRDFVKIFL